MKQYPFLFWNQDNKKYVVVIGQFDWTPHDFRWANDERVGDYPFIPDIDVALEHHYFDDERSALFFIKHWWGVQR